MRRRAAMRQQLDTAIRLSLAAQVRNRFAWILLVAFIPAWYLLTSSMFAHTGVEFRLQSTGATLVVDGHNLTLITPGSTRSPSSQGSWCSPRYAARGCSTGGSCSPGTGPP